jgi:hypothetical protein
MYFHFAFQEIVQGILPISYEDEIVQKRTQILRDPLQDLLLFPKDDISVSLYSVVNIISRYCTAIFTFDSSYTLNLHFSCQNLPICFAIQPLLIFFYEGIYFVL